MFMIRRLGRKPRHRRFTYHRGDAGRLSRALEEVVTGCNRGFALCRPVVCSGGCGCVLRGRPFVGGTTIQFTVTQMPLSNKTVEPHPLGGHLPTRPDSAPGMARGSFISSRRKCEAGSWSNRHKSRRIMHREPEIHFAEPRFHTKVYTHHQTTTTSDLTLTYR